MGGGQRRTYRVRLAADQFLKAVIEQDCIDVVAPLSGQDCERIMDFDTESRLRGQESVRQGAEVEGDYRLVVEPKLKEAPAGSYEIRIEELRAATENDRALQEARNLYREATDLRDAGKYDGAIPSYERAQEISERVLEPYPPDVAAPINGLAILYYHEGEYAKAESLRQHALAICEKALGPEHPDIAESLKSLAGLRSNTGDYAKDAESQYESVGEKLISEEQALFESHLVKCNHCRGVIEFATESESKGLLSLYLIPADNKRNYYRSARTSSLSENILVCGANSPI
jgi:tetratricopeptide (TPR) repeat protein